MITSQGALVVCGQLVNSIPELDAKLYASTQVVDEGRHVEVFERYVKKLHKIYPVDPLLKSLLDEILATNLWELKLLGMQMIVEGLAIAAFNVMRNQTGDPTLAQLLDYVLQDEGRHVNFGYFALRRSIPNMDAAKREFPPDPRDEELFKDVTFPLPKTADPKYFLMLPEFVPSHAAGALAGATAGEPVRAY